MSHTSNLDRQSIVNRVYTHFVVNRHPAGQLGAADCIYHGIDDDGRRVSCAIGLFDTEGRLDKEPLLGLSVLDLASQYPDVLCDVFDVPTLTDSDVNFLGTTQEVHDSAVAIAEETESFDPCFVEDLSNRLDWFAHEQGLVSPASSRDLSAA